MSYICVPWQWSNVVHYRDLSATRNCACRRIKRRSLASSKHSLRRVPLISMRVIHCKLTYRPNADGWFEALLVSLASLSDLCKIFLPVMLLIAMTSRSDSNLGADVSEVDPVIPFWFGFALQSVSSFDSVLVHTMSGKEGIASYAPLEGRFVYPFLILITLPRVCLKLCLLIERECS